MYLNFLSYNFSKIPIIAGFFFLCFFNLLSLNGQNVEFKFENSTSASIVDARLIGANNSVLGITNNDGMVNLSGNSINNELITFNHKDYPSLGIKLSSSYNKFIKVYFKLTNQLNDPRKDNVINLSVKIKDKTNPINIYELNGANLISNQSQCVSAPSNLYHCTFTLNSTLTNTGYRFVDTDPGFPNLYLFDTNDKIDIVIVISDLDAQDTTDKIKWNPFNIFKKKKKINKP